MTEDRMRVLRVLEYEGPRSWVENTLAENAIKGEQHFFPREGDAVITVVGRATVVLASKQKPSPGTMVEKPECVLRDCDWPHCNDYKGLCLRCGVLS